MDGLRKIRGIISVHDLHIWQLVDGLVIASVHVDVLHGADWAGVAGKIRKVFHKHRIHSVTIQPEFHEEGFSGSAVCDNMCVSECMEAWCCEDESGATIMSEFDPRIGVAARDEFSLVPVTDHIANDDAW